MAKSTQHRLFFAVDLASSIKTQLIQLQDTHQEIEGRPVAAENFHITLSFLGNTSDKQLETILDGICPLTQPAFEVSTEDSFYWPRPSIIAVAVNDEHNRLLKCKKQLEHQLSQLNFFSFKKQQYQPHITLFRSVETPPRQAIKFNQTIQVDHVSLMLSENTRNGVRYTSLEQWQLQAPSIKQQLLGHRCL